LSKSAENLNNFTLVKILEETLVIATGAVVGKGDQPFRVWLQKSRSCVLWSSSDPAPAGPAYDFSLVSFSLKPYSEHQQDQNK